MLTRESVRKEFEKYGLKYSDISSTEYYSLRKYLQASLTEFNEDEKQFILIKPKSKHLKFDDNGKIKYAAIRMKSIWFEDREVVTFNEEKNFIGFAGWADDTNIKPILKGFRLWMENLVVNHIENAF